jgi:hypothetical protein
MWPGTWTFRTCSDLVSVTSSMYAVHLHCLEDYVHSCVLYCTLSVATSLTNCHGRSQNVSSHLHAFAVYAHCCLHMPISECHVL